MIEECKPYWTKPNVLRDKNMNRPSDQNYDPTTLHVPAKAWKQMSSCMIQYWRLKQNNFDKLIFFKLGKFYEVFDDDAITVNKCIDLHWMSPDKKLHTSFPQ
jgi:DNA mismatch repair protein MSH6